jgi:hypothetical protein
LASQSAEFLSLKKRIYFEGMPREITVFRNRKAKKGKVIL